MSSRREEHFDVALSVLNRVGSIPVGVIRTAQDAAIHLRVDWETIQTLLRSKKTDSFEPLIEAITQLAATCMAVNSALQHRIKEQYELRAALEAHEKDVEVYGDQAEAVKPTEKPPRRRNK